MLLVPPGRQQRKPEQQQGLEQLQLVKMQDFRQNTDGDIDLSKGDIVYVESTVAHQRDLIITAPGELKFAPLSGVGIHDFINDESPADMLRMVRKKYIQDGQTVNSVKKNSDGQLEVDSYYDVYPVVPNFANV